MMSTIFLDQVNELQLSTKMIAVVSFWWNVARASTGITNSEYTMVKDLHEAYNVWVENEMDRLNEIFVGIEANMVDTTVFDAKAKYISELVPSLTAMENVSLDQVVKWRDLISAAEFTKEAWLKIVAMAKGCSMDWFKVATQSDAEFAIYANLAGQVWDEVASRAIENFDIWSGNAANATRYVKSILEKCRFFSSVLKSVRT